MCLVHVSAQAPHKPKTHTQPTGACVCLLKSSSGNPGPARPQECTPSLPASLCCTSLVPYASTAGIGQHAGLKLPAVRSVHTHTALSVYTMLLLLLLLWHQPQLHPATPCRRRRCCCGGGWWRSLLQLLLPGEHCRAAAYNHTAAHLLLLVLKSLPQKEGLPALGFSPVVACHDHMPTSLGLNVLYRSRSVAPSWCCGWASDACPTGMALL